MLIPIHKNENNEVEVCIDFPERMTNKWKYNNTSIIDFSITTHNAENNLFDNTLAIFYRRTQNSPENPCVHMIDKGGQILFHFDPNRLQELGGRFIYFIAMIQTQTGKLLNEVRDFTISVNQHPMFVCKEFPSTPTMIFAVLDLEQMGMIPLSEAIPGELVDAVNKISSLNIPEVLSYETYWEQQRLEGVKLQTFNQINEEEEYLFVQISYKTTKNQGSIQPFIFMREENGDTKLFSFDEEIPSIVAYKRNQFYCFQVHLAQLKQTGCQELSVLLQTEKEKLLQNLKKLDMKIYSGSSVHISGKTSEGPTLMTLDSSQNISDLINSQAQKISLFSLSTKENTLYGKLRSTVDKNHIFSPPPNNPMSVKTLSSLRTQSAQQPKQTLFDQSFQNNRLTLHSPNSNPSTISVHQNEQKGKQLDFTLSNTNTKTRIILNDVVSYDKIIRIDFSIKR